MKKYPVSAFIITLNEEKHLPLCLQSLHWVEEIILVDCGSEDNTLAIAEEFGAKIYTHEWPGYGAQKQYALSLCQCEWALNLDADEALTPELSKKLQAVIEENKHQAVRCLRDDVFMGRTLPRLVKKPNNLRFYKREIAHFEENKQVHESATVTAKELQVKQTFLHYGYGDIETITDKDNHYSSLRTQENIARNKRPSLLKLLLCFPVYMIKELILQRKILAGRRGFILAVMKSYYAFLTA